MIAKRFTCCSRMSDPKASSTGAWLRPEPEWTEVQNVVHATHLEYVPEMITLSDQTTSRVDVKFVSKEPHRVVNGLDPKDIKLLYFACLPLGRAWEKDCRYGSVAFRVDLKDLVTEAQYGNTKSLYWNTGFLPHAPLTLNTSSLSHFPPGNPFLREASFAFCNTSKLSS